jgi:hypothetical protein
MLGILAEDASDSASIKAIVASIREGKPLQVKTKDCQGCGEMYRKGKMMLRALSALGCHHFVICVDADGPDPKPRATRVVSDILSGTPYSTHSCIVVPIQEFESWILADVTKVTRVMSSWKPSPVRNPESISSPKEFLTRMSKNSQKRPIYDSVTHNPRIAMHLDPMLVRERCPSFRPLYDFVSAIKN